MSTGQILVVAFAAIALVAAAGIFTIAYRKGGGPTPRTGRVDRKAIRRHRDARRTQAVRTPDPDREKELVTAGAPPAAPADPLKTREPLPADEYDASRRRFFNRGLLGVWGLFLAQFGIASLAFMWPRLRSGGFGSKVTVGKIDEIEARLLTPEGRVVPLFIPSAQSYVVPFTGDVSDSSFDGIPVIVGGVMALWQRCVHLGCRVPQCDASQGFECPCHGSKYNYHGEYEDGPAPRNLDRFVVTINESNELVIDTGQVIETARSSVKTTEYPQGPSCI